MWLTLKKGDAVVLLKNNKKVGRGKIFSLRSDSGVGITIHGVLYTPDKDNIEVESVEQGRDTEELPIPVSSFKTLKDSVGGFVPWMHNQVRFPIEDGDSLDEAWVRLLEDENVLSYGLSEHASVDRAAEEALEANNELTNNDRYLNAVTKNSLTSNIQAQQHLNRADQGDEQKSTEQGREGGRLRPLLRLVVTNIRDHFLPSFVFSLGTRPSPVDYISVVVAAVAVVDRGATRSGESSQTMMTTTISTAVANKIRWMRTSSTLAFRAVSIGPYRVNTITVYHRCSNSGDTTMSSNGSTTSSQKTLGLDLEKSGMFNVPSCFPHRPLHHQRYGFKGYNNRLSFNHFLFKRFKLLEGL